MMHLIWLIPAGLGHELLGTYADACVQIQRLVCLQHSHDWNDEHSQSVIPTFCPVLDETTPIIALENHKPW